MAGLAIQPAPLAGTGQRFASAPSSVLREIPKVWRERASWDPPAYTRCLVTIP